MNEELLKQLIPIAEVTKEGILKGVEIAQQQVPELINQILVWCFIKSLFSFIIGVCCLVSLIWLFRLAPKWWKEANYNPTFKTIFSIMWGIIGTIGGIIGITDWIWIKILVAPKLFLVDYLTNLIK